jgi:hypothetical protein
VVTELKQSHLTKSSNHTLSLHRLTSKSFSATNFPWLFPADNWLSSNSHTPYSSKLEPESYIKTHGQSESQSWNKAPIWGLRPDFYYCQTLTNFLMWGAFSDERMGLSFTFAAGPRQCSYFRAWVPSVSWPYLLPQIRDFSFHRLLSLAGLQCWFSTTSHLDWPNLYSSFKLSPLYSHSTDHVDRKHSSSIVV